MNKEILTTMEREIWVILLRYMADNFFAPTRTELAEKLSDKKNRYSPQIVQYYLKGLERKGYIKINPLKKRGIVIT